MKTKEKDGGRGKHATSTCTTKWHKMTKIYVVTIRGLVLEGKEAPFQG